MILNKDNIFLGLLRRISTRIKSVLVNIFFLFFLIFLISPNNSKATHISGADLTYRWISGNTFEITLTLYRDCSGIAAPDNVTINYKSPSCGSNNNVTLNKILGTGLEITQPCSTSTTTCSGGSNPGIQKFVYTGTVTLPSQCSDWVFSYSVCCRNCAISTLSYTPNNCSGVPATYVEATLNNLADPTNSSPAFTNPPLSFLCLGQTFHYNHGAYDLDGDSLVYSLINPRSAEGTDVVFKPGYSATKPISSAPPLTISSTSGDMVIRPSSVEVAVMAILIKEYRNGILVGTVVRDMEIWTQGCTNTLPSVSGINGSNNFSIVACPGVPVSFTINSTDGDASQTLSMVWNNGIPGAAFVTSSSSRPVGTFSWTPLASDSRDQPYQFTVTIQDDACPSNSFQTYSYSVIVPKLSATVTALSSNCAFPVLGSATVYPSGNGPFQYLWTPGGGVGSTFNNLSAGTYNVRVTDANGCTLNQPATIVSPPVLNASLNGINHITCNGMNNGTISVTASGGVSPYTYSWSPSGGNTATASSLSPGTYTVTVTDANLCTKTASTTITQPSILSATTNSSTLLCFGMTNATASVTPAGGTSPYSYNWSNGKTTSNIDSLSSGTYSVTITDAKGCTTSKTINITQPAPLSITMSTTQALCGLANGSATATISGGTPSFTYNWSPGGENNPSITNKFSGNYSVTVTDNNGCTSTSSIGIPGTTGPVMNLSSLAPVSCFGKNDGAASVSLTGGIGPFVYNWSPAGGSASSASGLTAGNYLVSVTDSNGCNTSLALNITEPPILKLNTIVNDPTCFASNNGSITLNVSGGSPTYSYTWSGGFPDVSTIENLSSGTYTVTVNDNKGCADSATVILTEPTQLAGTINEVTDVSCKGGNNGSATITASGGTSPYLYSWNPGGYSLPSVSGLSAKLYTVKVTDANNCTINIPITVNEPSLMVCTIDSVQNILCNGGNTGYAQSSVTGGTPPYSYLWNPNGETTSAISNLAVGSYPVIVTDSNGCSATATIDISTPNPLSAVLWSSSDVSCNGKNDGAAMINATGGTMPYSYQWSEPGISGSASTTLAPNNYSVIVSDANGCSVTVAFTINEPDTLTAFATSSPALCYGSSDGRATVVTSGGNPQYFYLWNTGDTSSTASGLTAGNYSVLITDERGCTYNTSAIVSEPTQLSLNVTVVNAKCSKSNGSASVDVTGGTAGYSYLWSDNSLTSLIDKKSAGTYTISVTDANGCSATQTANISNTAAPVITITSTTNVFCPGGSDGAATISATGGKTPYTYNWSPSGGTLPTATGLQAGTYLMTLVDKNNCITVMPVDISQPAPFNFNVNSTGVNCRGGNNGAATVNATGGTGALTYIWNTGDSGNTISNRTAGAYVITVSDQRNCTKSSQVNIVEPAQLTATMNIVIPVSCHGAQDASAQIIGSGGTLPYSYAWNEFANTSNTATGLKAGNYTSTVTDAHGCVTTSGLIISEPQVLVANTATKIGTCDNPNGTATAIVNGGTSPYSYFWQQTGDTTASISGLATGTYVVTATDISGCKSTASAYVQNTGTINVSLFSTKPVSCFGGNDGEILVNTTHGSPPYSYNWTSGGTNAQATGLTAGTYNVTVTDTNNCEQTLSAVITEPPSLSSAITTTNVKCMGASNGSATVNVTGGTGNYIYEWQPGGSNATSISALSGGLHTIKVTDANGCSSITSFNIFEPAELIVSTTTKPAGCLLSNGSATAIPSGGTPPYKYQWSQGQSSTDKLEGVPAGSYSIVVTDTNNCSATTQASVSNTVGPSVNLAFNKSTSCFNGTDGEAEVTIINGTAPFTYNWFPTGTSSINSGSLPAGDYSFTVRDSNNCFGSLDVTISEATQLSATLTTKVISCYNGNNGELQSVITGGIPPYQYLWSNGDTTSLATQLSQGTHSLMVTDSNGCQRQFSGNLNEPAELVLAIQTVEVNCYNGNDGLATAIASGGVGVYNYVWSNGSTSSAAMNLQKGTYTVTITDSHGCSIDSTISIEEPTEVTGTYNSTPVFCYGGNNGNAFVEISGGTEPYNYNWSPYGGNMGAANNLESGNYVVTVRDENNCLLNIPVIIDSPTEININATTDSVRCFGGQDGAAHLIVDGGTNPYTCFWNNGSTLFDAVQLRAGNYFVAVTDSNGCNMQHSVTVNEPTIVTASAETPSIICIGQGALLDANAEGGHPPYSYSWSSGETTKEMLASPETTTNYTVIAYDANGCSSLPQLVTVSVNPPLSTSTITIDTICEGTSAVLIGYCSGGNGGPYHYSWDTGQQGPTLAVTPTTSTTYTITATDECGTPASSASIVVNVSPTPKVDFTQSIVSGCQPLVVEFRDSSDLEGYELYWSFGDGHNGETNNPTHIYTEPGNYTVNYILKTEMGCESRKTKPGAVKVYPKPHADFTAEPETASVFVPQIFFNETSSNTSNWIWNFGDKSGNYSQPNISHTYNESGKYSVRLITISDRGCRDTTYREILITGEFAIYIPNAFSPNNDGVNDRFSPLGLGIDKFEMAIYDRWGSKIFVTNDIRMGWDGKDPNTEMEIQSDVYVYYITVSDFQNKSYNYSGRVSLVR